MKTEKEDAVTMVPPSAACLKCMMLITSFYLLTVRFRRHLDALWLQLSFHLLLWQIHAERFGRRLHAWYYLSSNNGNDHGDALDADDLLGAYYQIEYRSEGEVVHTKMGTDVTYTAHYVMRSAMTTNDWTRLFEFVVRMTTSRLSLMLTDERPREHDDIIVFHVVKTTILGDNKLTHLNFEYTDNQI